MDRRGRRAWLAAVIGAALCLAAVTPAEAKRVPAFDTEIGHWHVVGYNDDDPMCAAVVHGDKALFLFDYIPKDGYALNLVDQTGAWQPVDGQAYELTATLDGKDPVTVSGVGWQKRLVILLGGDDTALDPFRNGGVVAVEVADRRFEVDLMESGEALSAFRVCVKQIFGDGTP